MAKESIYEVLQKEVVKTGTGVEKRKRRSSTARAACAREVLWRRCMRQASRLLKRPQHYVALTNASVLPLPVLKSDRHTLRHRFSARGSLHRDLDLAARCPAVLARVQPSGY
eukprot:6188576-Pleurochrysis_carterae.AAC.1